MRQRDEFGEAVRERMPEIDQILAEQNMSFGVRPLNAAIHFVKHWVLDINGGIKEQFWDQEWFAILYWHVRNWYKDFYGNRLDNSKQFLPGVVFINSTPFRLRIACTRSELEEEGKSCWLIFLSESDDHEPLEDLFELPPNLGALATEERAVLELRISQVVAATRALNLDLMTADLDGDSLQRFRSSVLVHLENAINAATGNSQEGMSVAMWELHLMVEKCIKLLLKQNKVKCPNSHDLQELRGLADFIVDSRPLRDDFRKTLSKSQAISYRYCEAGLVTADVFVELYLASLAICVFYAEMLQRVRSFRGLRVLLNKPPWLELPDA